MKTITVIMMLASLLNASESKIFTRAIIYMQDKNIAHKIANDNYQSSIFKKIKQVTQDSKAFNFSINTTTSLMEDYPPPSKSYLRYFGRDITKEQVDFLYNTKIGLIIDFVYTHKNWKKGLKKSNELIYSLSNHGLIWDSETRELFNKKSWKKYRLDSWYDGFPIVESHTVIHAYNTGKKTRAITLGMVKFGQPDIVADEFSWSLSRSMGDLLTLVCQSLIEGTQIDNKNNLLININSLSNSPYKEKMIQSLYDNSVDSMKLNFKKGKWEEGDPYNHLIEINFNNNLKLSVDENQQEILSKVFGWRDNLSQVKHNQLILDASKRAKEKLSNLKKVFNNKLLPGEYILLKAPFKTPDGRNEWMWVEVLQWESKRIKGLLKNQPYNIPELKGGSEVIINQDDVFDYIRYFQNGKTEGNETGKLILKYQKK